MINLRKQPKLLTQNPLYEIKVGFAALVMLLFGTVSFAQESYTLKGKVTSASDNSAIPSANVVVVGGSNATVTDIQGNYEIMVKSGDSQWNFRFVGYIAQTVAITNQTTLDIKLVEDSESLDEVYVVGYGVRKKSHNTGAISQVDGKAVASIQSARVDDALAGKLSGVLVQNQRRRARAAPKIQVVLRHLFLGIQVLS